MLSHIFLSHFVLFAILTSGQSADKICTSEESVPIANQILKVGLKDGLYIAMFQQLSPIALLNAETPEGNENYENKVCFGTPAKTSFGTFEVKGNIRYNDPDKVRLVATGDGGFLFGELKVSADLRSSKTDNQTFVLYITCIGGQTPFWLALGVIPKLNDTVEAEILEHLQSIGFSKSDAAPPNDPLRGTKIAGQKCEGESEDVAQESQSENVKTDAGGTEKERKGKKTGGKDDGESKKVNSSRKKESSDEIKKTGDSAGDNVITHILSVIRTHVIQLLSVGGRKKT